MKTLIRCCLLLAATSSTDGADAEVLERVQLALVKVYGAGGVAGLEGYQTGVFLAEPAAVLTVDSPVLGAGRITLVDAFGDRHEGRLLGRDGPSGLALISLPDSVTPPGSLDLSLRGTEAVATPVWVLSNAFGIASGDEPVTVQRGRVATTTRLPLPQTGSRPRVGVPKPSTIVHLLDAITSNPGAAGGVVVDEVGRPLGVLGAECRSPITGAWINYALPAGQASAAVERMLSRSDEERPSESLMAVFRWRDELRETGVALLPTLSNQTPAYVEQVDRGSNAERAGCRPDDLIVAVAGSTVADVEAAGAAIVRALRSEGRAELTLLRDRRVVRLALERDAP